MAENPKVCYICDQNHTNKPSTDWCSECEQAFCQECLKFHGVSKLSKNHTTIPITDHLTLQESLPDIQGYCTAHEEVYQLFCASHDCPLCHSCLMEHSECKNLISLSKVTKDIKTSDSFKDAQQSLTDIEANIKQFQDHLRNNLSDVHHQEETIMKEIKDARKKIEEHLDEIEKALKDEVSDSVTKCSNEMEATIKALDNKKTEIERYRQQITDLSNYGSEFQAFFGLKQVASNLSECEHYLEKTVDGDTLDNIKVTCQQDDIINSMTKFGSVQVERKRCGIKVQRTKDKQAQLIGGRNKSCHDIKVTLVKKIVLVGKRTKGCCILPDGKIVVSDYGPRDCIDIYGSDGSHLFLISMEPKTAFDVTPLDDDRVAVSSGSRNGINIVNINTRTIEKYIQTDDTILGIKHNEGSLLCSVNASGIVSIDLKTERVKSLTKHNLSSGYIDSFQQKIYYTNGNLESVTCCDIEGKTIWIYQDKTIINRLRGISVDKSGNVYVACTDNNSVIILSPDGHYSRTLLSEEDGLEYPSAVYYDTFRNWLLVADMEQTVFVYELL